MGPLVELLINVPVMRPELAAPAPGPSSNMREVILWGGTGQARALSECLFGTEGSLTYREYERSPSFARCSVPRWGRGLRSWMKSHRGDSDIYLLAAVGGHDRLKLHDWLANQSLLSLTVVHRMAYVAADATLGQGCQILANATVCAQARLERSVIVNTAPSVDHECRIAAGVHIGPGVRVAGRVAVGECAFIGAGAVILPRLTIGRDATIGAGAVVIADVPAGAVAMGVPARIKSNKSQQPLPPG
jgi:sugar O-acyltransferase (sialic acid O-acetyltransferase NeuD family)